MASTGASDSSAPRPVTDIRRALCILLSAKEYRRLHELAGKYTPSGTLASLPSPSRYESIVYSKHKHNEAAVRSSLRVFVGTGAVMKLAEVIIGKIKKDAAE